MNISNQQSGQLRISDFGLVAALVTCGYSIIGTEKEGQRVFFIFYKSPELDKTHSNILGK